MTYGRNKQILLIGPWHIGEVGPDGVWRARCGVVPRRLETSETRPRYRPLMCSECVRGPRP